MLTLHTRICIVQSTLYKLWHKQPLPCTVFFTTLDHCHYTIPIKPNSLHNKSNEVSSKGDQCDIGLSLMYMCYVWHKGIHNSSIPNSRLKKSLIIRQIRWYSCYSFTFTHSFLERKLRLVCPF